MSGIRDLAARVDAATPASRDRTVDALRALAIMGVILGHWMVTALVLTNGKTGSTLHDASPLASLPALTPVSWVFQTLAIFFLVGGYSAARSYSASPRGDDPPSTPRRGASSAIFRGYRSWLGKRLARLSRPVVALVGVWTLLGTGLYLGGVSASTLHTALLLVLDPLWFLGVYAVLTALTPLAVALVRRLGAAAAAIPFLVVAGVDAVRFGLGGPSWVGWINVLAGWMVPYLLGIAWGRGAFAGRKVPALMLIGGVAATVALVLRGGYPASMVGVNGAKISNLNPPTLAVVTFGIAQVGLALLLRPLLARWMRRPVAWAAVATANLSAMTLFLWHQTAFLSVTMLGLLAGRLAGLHTAPTSFAWVAERLAWLPVFAAALAVLWLVFRRAERAPRSRRRARAIRPGGHPPPDPFSGRSGDPAADPPGAEPGQRHREADEDRGLGPLEVPEAAGRLVGDDLPQVEPTDPGLASRAALPERGHDQEPHRPHPGQARPARPGADRRLRLREGDRAARPVLARGSARSARLRQERRDARRRTARRWAATARRAGPASGAAARRRGRSGRSPGSAASRRER
jgi:Acyltransferase family